MRSRSLRRTCWASRRWGCAGQPLKTIAGKGRYEGGGATGQIAVRRVSRGARRQVGARRDEDGVRARTLCRVGSRPCRPKARPLPTVAGHGRAPAHRIPRGDHVTLTGGKSDRPRFREEISCLFQDSRRAPRKQRRSGVPSRIPPRVRARASLLRVRWASSFACASRAWTARRSSRFPRCARSRSFAAPWLRSSSTTRGRPRRCRCRSIASTTSARAGRASPPRSARAA